MKEPRVTKRRPEGLYYRKQELTCTGPRRHHLATVATAGEFGPARLKCNDCGTWSTKGAPPAGTGVVHVRCGELANVPGMEPQDGCRRELGYVATRPGDLFELLCACHLTWLLDDRGDGSVLWHRGGRQNEAPRMYFVIDGLLRGAR